MIRRANPPNIIIYPLIMCVCVCAVVVNFCHGPLKIRALAEKHYSASTSAPKPPYGALASITSRVKVAERVLHITNARAKRTPIVSDALGRDYIIIRIVYTYLLYTRVRIPMYTRVSKCMQGTLASDSCRPREIKNLCSR